MNKEKFLELVGICWDVQEKHFQFDPDSEKPDEVMTGKEDYSQMQVWEEDLNERLEKAGIDPDDCVELTESLMNMVAEQPRFHLQGRLGIHFFLGKTTDRDFWYDEEKRNTYSINSKGEKRLESNAYVTVNGCR